MQQDVVDVFARRSPTKCFGNMLEVFNLMLYVYTICIYMLYVYIIYVIDIRGNRLTEGTSMYWRIKGHKDPLIYFVPAIGQSTLKCCPPSHSINMSTRIDDHPCSGKIKDCENACYCVEFQIFHNLEDPLPNNELLLPLKQQVRCVNLCSNSTSSAFFNSLLYTLCRAARSSFRSCPV